MKTMTRQAVLLIFVGLIGLTGGCPIDEILDDLEELELTIINQVGDIQDRDPRFDTLPAGLIEREETIIIEEETTVITDVSTQLIVEELPNITLLGLENDTGYDVYIRYAVDGLVQGALIYDGETLLLEYDCLDAVELLSEEDFDPFDGTFIDEFDLTGIDFFNGLDFFCGEALIITIDPFAVDARIETIDLF